MTSILCTCQYCAQDHSTDSSFLTVHALGCSGIGSGPWLTAPLVGGEAKVPSSWLWPGTPPGVAGI